MQTSDIEERLDALGIFDAEMVEDNAPPVITEVLNKLIDESKTTKADIIRILNVARNYGYQILNGTRPLTRNMLLQISLILKLDIDKINYLLRLAGRPPLYVRNLVDARVFFAVKHGMDYYDAMDFIWGSRVI